MSHLETKTLEIHWTSQASHPCLVQNSWDLNRKPKKHHFHMSCLVGQHCIFCQCLVFWRFNHEMATIHRSGKKNLNTQRGVRLLMPSIQKIECQKYRGLDCYTSRKNHIHVTALRVTILFSEVFTCLRVTILFSGVFTHKWVQQSTWAAIPKQTGFFEIWDHPPQRLPNFFFFCDAIVAHRKLGAYLNSSKR